MKKILFVLAILFCVCLSDSNHSLSAQEKEKKDVLYNYSIAVQPLYLVNGGLRIDFEKRLKDPRHMLQVSAIGYIHPRRDDPYEHWESLLIDDYYDVNKLMGAGLAVDHKWFLFPKARFLYLSAGVSYTYFDVRYNGFKNISFVEDGLTFYETRYMELKQTFNKVGGNVCFGLQTAPRRPFFIDGYVGFGYSYSFYDEKKFFIEDNMFNIGYRGLTFTTGIRIGYRFGKR